MSYLLLSLGAAVVVVAFVDTVWTTLGFNRAGPLTGRLADGLWRGLLALHRRTGGHRLLAPAGTLILLSVALAWIVLVWAGWTLVFSADPASIVQSQTQEPAGLLERIYFVGYTFVTLGLGDWVPQGGWRIATVLCALHGLSALTLAISYFLSVLDAVAGGRQLAAVVSGLGSTPAAVLAHAWTGRDFGALPQHLSSLVPLLARHTHLHLAFPVLHYFHRAEPDSSPALRLAGLDEALTLLLCAVPEGERPPPPTLRAVRFACTSYLRLLEDVYVEPADEGPPPPDLAPLREAGIPVVSEAAFRAALDELADRRRLLVGLVRHDGWGWEDVTAPPD